jgi:hypothetical protein
MAMLAPVTKAAFALKQEAAGAQNANRLMSTGNFGAPGRI